MERPVGPIRPWEVGLGSGRDPQEAHAPHPNERNPGWHPTGGRINPERVCGLMTWPGRGPGGPKEAQMNTGSTQILRMYVLNVLRGFFSESISMRGRRWTSRNLQKQKIMAC